MLNGHGTSALVGRERRVHAKCTDPHRRAKTFTDEPPAATATLASTTLDADAGAVPLSTSLERNEEAQARTARRRQGKPWGPRTSHPEVNACRIARSDPQEAQESQMTRQERITSRQTRHPAQRDDLRMC